mgnify:CR=1 FL=1
MLKDFREFIMRGNVIDLAVAVIIGAAFSAIVSSLVADVITPGLLNPVMDKLKVDELAGLEWNGILYGKFLAAVLNFLVVAVVIFMLVRSINKAQALFEKKKEEEAKEEKVPEDVKLLREIRDALKK